MLHVPVLRAGEPYRSIERVRLPHVRTGEPVAEVSQANRGLIARDLRGVSDHRAKLRAIPAAKLVELFGTAADRFMNAELPLDAAAGTTQGPEEFVAAQSATTGMPRSLCRANMEKIRFVMAEMAQILGGLTRGLDLAVLDDGWVRQDGRTVSYLGQADALGAVLPSNSPGVHSLWIPSIALKVPVVLKPGRLEPWTPSRIAQSIYAAGFPRESVSFYPADYAGATEILLRCDRSMIFGDESTVAPWKGDTRVQLHGPGWSKIVLGRDEVDAWHDHLDLMVTSIAENGGRSCVNASGIWVPARGREIAEALAERLAAIEARPLDDPEARLAAFPQPEVAHAFSDYLDRQLAVPGAVDLTRELRGGERVVEVDGCSFVLPTLVWCEDPEHPLAACELLFPFASVVQVPQESLVDRMGATLVATAITGDAGLTASLIQARNVDRLNLGLLPTCRVPWDQPHEGNLFEHLYRQRAFQQQTGDPSASAA